MARLSFVSGGLVWLLVVGDFRVEKQVPSLRCGMTTKKNYGSCKGKGNGNG